MMKILLALSILGNVILGHKVFSKKEVPPVRERLIIETHKNPQPKETHDVKSVNPVKPIEPQNKQAPEKNEKKDPPEFMSMDPYDFQDSGERMEMRRTEFMTQELGMSEEKIAQHNDLRQEFYKETSRFYDKNPLAELSFEERRQIIDLEEMFHKRLEKLHGKENWKRYQKFRNDYNMKGHKKQMEDGQPFIFMTL